MYGNIYKQEYMEIFPSNVWKYFQPFALVAHCVVNQNDHFLMKTYHEGTWKKCFLKYWFSLHLCLDV